MREREERSRRWYWLLVIPLLGTLIPPIYNHAEPDIGGIPFFYWYQLVWVVLSVGVTLLVRRLTAPERRDVR